MKWFQEIKSLLGVRNGLKAAARTSLFGGSIACSGPIDIHKCIRVRTSVIDNYPLTPGRVKRMLFREQVPRLAGKGSLVVVDSPSRIYIVNQHYIGFFPAPVLNSRIMQQNWFKMKDFFIAESAEFNPRKIWKPYLRRRWWWMPRRQW